MSSHSSWKYFDALCYPTTSHHTQAITLTVKRVSFAAKSVPLHDQMSDTASDSSSIQVTLKCCDLSLPAPFHACRLNIVSQSHYSRYCVHNKNHREVPADENRQYTHLVIINIIFSWEEQHMSSDKPQYRVFTIKLTGISDLQQQDKPQEFCDVSHFVTKYAGQKTRRKARIRYQITRMIKEW